MKLLQVFLCELWFACMLCRLIDTEMEVISSFLLIGSKYTAPAPFYSLLHSGAIQIVSKHHYTYLLAASADWVYALLLYFNDHEIRSILKSSHDDHYTNTTLTCMLPCSLSCLIFCPISASWWLLITLTTLAPYVVRQKLLGSVCKPGTNR